MKNIAYHPAEKYRDAAQYAEVADGIHRTQDDEGLYVTSLSFELEPEAGEGENAETMDPDLIEDICDKFFVHVADFYDDLNSADSPTCYLEFGGTEQSDIEGVRSLIGKRAYHRSETRDGATYLELVIE